LSSLTPGINEAKGQNDDKKRISKKPKKLNCLKINSPENDKDDINIESHEKKGKRYRNLKDTAPSRTNGRLTGIHMFGNFFFVAI